MAEVVHQETEYLPGRGMDIFACPGGGPAVLLWHGRGGDERDVMAPLARLTASLGTVVFVPDWRCDTPDGGRSELLASAEFVCTGGRRLAGAGTTFVIAGWSRGGKAAAALALRPGGAGDRAPLAAVCLAAGFSSPDPLTGVSPLRLAAVAIIPPPIYLVHGTSDDVVNPEQSRTFAAELRRHGHRVELREYPSDHAGVVMAEYDPDLGRCRPATAEHAIGAGRLAARTIWAACAAGDGNDDLSYRPPPAGG